MPAASLSEAPAGGAMVELVEVGVVLELKVDALLDEVRDGANERWRHCGSLIRGGVLESRLR